MNCDVHVYDEKLARISRGKIDATMAALDGCFVDQKPVPIVPGSAMATLGPVPVGKILELVVDDTSLQFAATVLTGLNGDRTFNLHVTLFPLPSGILATGGAGPGGTTSDVIGFSQERVDAGDWTPDEKAGVVSLYSAAVHVMAAESASNLKQKLPAWRAKLAELGIALPSRAVRGPGRTPPEGGRPPIAGGTVGGYEQVSTDSYEGVSKRALRMIDQLFGHAGPAEEQPKKKEGEERSFGRGLGA